MSFERGCISFRAYSVNEPPADAMDRTATMAVRRYGFRPINDERGERESFGWIDLRQPLNDRPVWEEMREGHLMVLGVRKDTKAFSQFFYKARLEARVERVKEEKGLERITRQHRLAIEEELTIQMLKETSPTTSTVEVIWDRNTGEVLIGCASNAMCERIVDLFKATFDVGLSPRFPAFLAYEAAMAEGWELPPMTEAELAGHFVAYGPKFLTHLLLEGWSAREGTPVTVEGPLVFRDANEKETIVLQGEGAAEYPEAEAAAKGGRRLYSAGLWIKEEDAVWTFQIAGTTFDVTGMKVPVPRVADRDEGLVLRVEAVQYLNAILRRLFLDFVREEVVRECRRGEPCVGEAMTG